MPPVGSGPCDHRIEGTRTRGLGGAQSRGAGIRTRKPDPLSFPAGISEAVPFHIVERFDFIRREVNVDGTIGIFACMRFNLKHNDVR